MLLHLSECYDICRVSENLFECLLDQLSVCFSKHPLLGVGKKMKISMRHFGWVGGKDIVCQNNKQIE